MTETFREATIAKLNAREEEMWGHDRRPVVWRLPSSDEVLVRSSHVRECLTHLARHVSGHHRRADGGEPVLHHTVFTAWCGMSLHRAILVPVEDETFVCHRCIEVAEHRGEPTFSMIPNTGCEVTGGKRWRPR